jgi:iron(III) transport system permease protein
VPYQTFVNGSPDYRTLRRLAAALLVLGLLAAVPWAMRGDERTWMLARNTLLLAAGTCAIGLPVGTGLALLLVRTDLPGRRVGLVLLGAMLFVPLYLQAAGWQAGFGQQGWYSLATSRLSVPPLLWQWRGAIWVHAMAAVAWVVLIVGVGLRFVEPELEEEALLEGSPVQVFTRVTLRRAVTSMGVAALWILVTTAAEMTVTDIYQVRTYAEELYTGFALGDEPAQAALGVLPGMAVVAWLVVAAMLAAAAVAPPDVSVSIRSPWTFRLGAWRWPAALLVGAVVIAVVGVPVGNLCYMAGLNVQQTGDELLRVWSFGKFTQTLATSPRQFGEQFGWSLSIGAAAATVAVLVAAPLAWLARRGGVRAAPAIVIAAVCLAIPGPLVGLGVIWLLNRDEPAIFAWLYDRTILAPVLAMTVRSLPLAILVCWYALRSLSADVLDSAATEGAGPLVRFFRIAAPQRLLAFATAWLAALAIAMGDLAASIMVVPPGVDTLAIRIFGLVHYGVTDQLAGLCLTTVAGFGCLAAAVMGLFYWSQRNPRSCPTRIHVE